MQRSVFRALCMVAVATALTSAAKAASPSDFNVFSWDRYDNGTTDWPGQLYIPDAPQPAKGAPLVVFFHGAGEVGTNNTSQINGNINSLLAKAEPNNFYLYAPQTWSAWGPDQLEYTMIQVAKLVIDGSVDPNRIYSTGISLGGGAAWDLPGRYQGAIAATAPLSGVAPQVPATTQIGTPIWAYHAENDGNPATRANVTRSRINLIRTLQGLPAVTFPLDADPSNPFYNTGAPYYSDGSTFFSDGDIRYSEYQTGGHSNATWSRAYSEQPLYDWMLAKRSPIKFPQVGQTMYFDFGADKKTTVDSQQRLWNSTEFAMGSTLGPVTPFAKLANGIRTTVILEVVDKFDSDNGTGAIAGGLFDDEFMADSWANTANTHAEAVDDIGLIRIHGLAPNALYILELFASVGDDDGGLGRMTRYTVGDEFRDLDPVGNLFNTAVFVGAAADQHGVLELIVNASPDSTSRSSFLGTLKLTAITVPEPATALMVLVALALPRRRRAA